MITVRFLVDYRGVLTAEKYYQSGVMDSFEKIIAHALVDAGRAVYVEQAPPEPIEIKIVNPIEPVLAVDLEGISLKELRAMAKEAGVKGYSRMKRDTLIRHLQDD